jgi:hypothetical protein
LVIPLPYDSSLCEWIRLYPFRSHHSHVWPSLPFQNNNGDNTRNKE